MFKDIFELIRALLYSWQQGFIKYFFSNSLFKHNEA